MNPQEMGGWFDNLLASLLSMLKPDLSKWDKAKAKSGVSLLIDSLKPTVTLPGDFDDKALDMLRDAIFAVIDQINNQGPIVMGDASDVGDGYTLGTEVAAEQVESFLATCDCSEDRKERVRKHKRIMRILHAKKDGVEVFTDEDRRKIVGSFPLLLLQLIIPFIVQILLKWLGK